MHYQLAKELGLLFVLVWFDPKQILLFKFFDLSAKLIKSVIYLLSTEGKIENANILLNFLRM